jgi:hypothetical protein
MNERDAEISEFTQKQLHDRLIEDQCIEELTKDAKHENLPAEIPPALVFPEFDMKRALSLAGLQESEYLFVDIPFWTETSQIWCRKSNSMHEDTSDYETRIDAVFLPEEMMLENGK